jgi:hypothetical protein
MLNESYLNDAFLNGNGQGFNPNSGNTDFALGSITVSDYKWLTQTLKTAQLQFNVRPYFSCEIIDDSIVPNQILTPPGQPLNGSSVTAPDGAILSVGKISSTGYLGFWKVTDASIAGVWASPTTVLDATSGSSVSNGYRGDMNAAINVSEYIAGTYTIDVYYFKTASSLLVIGHQRSTDGGLTWSSVIAPNATGIASSGSSYIAAGKPVQDINGKTTGVFFYINHGASNDTVHYQYYAGTGSSFSADTVWSPKNINSGDWKLHSLDSYFKKGIYYIVFSGYHQVIEDTNDNYSIYTTALLSLTSSISTDLWDFQRPVLSSLSSASINQNSFTFPKASFDGTNVWVLFNAQIVSSIKTSATPSDPGNTVTTTTQYFLTRTQNMIDFTYPFPVMFTDGTAFMDTAGNNFVIQGSYYYILGNGNLWQYVQNNIIADITNDTLGFSIQENAGEASSISLQVGNQNNQWVGASPTKPGAAAIAKDKKILLSVGYYNGAGVPETVPRNIYFIDDIAQNVNTTSNDLTITGRDFRRNLKNLVSAFLYNYNGPFFYNDIMDGTTVSNWNQNGGTWTQTLNEWATQDSNGSAPNYDNGTQYTLTLAQPDLGRSTSLYSVIASFPFLSTASCFATFYAFYQDAANWVRLRVNSINGDSSQWSYVIEKSVAGTVTSLQTGNITSANGRAQPYPVIIKKTNFYKYQFIVGNNYTASGNGILSYQPSANIHVLGGEVDLTSDFTAGNFTRGSVGFGSQNFPGQFSFFKYMQYSDSLNIAQLLESIGVKARVFKYKPENNFIDPIFNPAIYTGTFTQQNRIISVANQNLVYKKKEFISDPTDLTFTDGEVRFMAKVGTGDPTQDYGFNFIFRSATTANSSNSYQWNIAKKTGNSGVAEITSRFSISNSTAGAVGVLMQSSSIVDYTTAYATTSGLNVDLTQWNEYRLVATDGWMLGFINNILVLAWYDNNTTANNTSGYIGFQPNANSTLQFKELISGTFWNQIEAYSINPDDDMETPVDNLSGIIRGWNFSDLMGRFKSVVLRSDDGATYDYSELVLQQQTDNSAKEYSNQVTVYGAGVSAVAHSGASIGENQILRNLTITDYKIKTYNDALNRANYELTNANIFNNQSTITQNINAGAEIFDAVGVNNTGDNSSEVDSTLRVYNEQFASGDNNKTSFAMQLETGNI